MDETINDPTTEAAEPTTPGSGESGGTGSGTTDPTTPTEPTAPDVSSDYKAVGLDVLEDMFLAFGQGLPGLLVGEGGEGSTSGFAARLIPSGGAVGTVLSKVSGTDYDITWADMATMDGTVPKGGTTGQFLSKGSNSDYDLHWETLIIPEVQKLNSAEMTLIAEGKTAEVTDQDKKVIGVSALLKLLEVMRAEDDVVAESAVTADETTITKSEGNILSVATGGIGETHLAADAVTTDKIADAAVTTAEIADANVTAVKLADDVWTKVNEIMDTGFGEILNGTY